MPGDATKVMKQRQHETGCGVRQVLGRLGLAWLKGSAARAAAVVSGGEWCCTGEGGQETQVGLTDGKCLGRRRQRRLGGCQSRG